VHDVIGELREEVQEDECELVLENASIKSMSSSDDDNDFSACWKVSEKWRRVFSLLFLTLRKVRTSKVV